MNDDFLLRAYIEALEKALKNDDVNFGYLVKDYSFYVQDDDLLLKIENYTQTTLKNKLFFELVEMYFFAKSHYQDHSNGIRLSIVREHIIDGIKNIKKMLSILA